MQRSYDSLENQNLTAILAKAEADLARRDLAEFVRQAWHVLEPTTPLVWNWHIDAICQHLMAVADGRIRRLIINIPPGHMKSLLVSVFFPAWMWLKDPSWRLFSCSYAKSLATRDTVKTRDIITSDWYRETFDVEWQMATDQNLKTNYKNTATGERLCASTGSAVVGFRGDCITVDDPLNTLDAYSQLKRTKANEWLGKAMSTRLNHAETDPIIIVMQRLHEDDPTGHFLESGLWTHLCLPSEYDPDRHCKTDIGWEDPRTKKGELLFPQKFPQTVLDEAKDPTNLGPRDFAGQHNQHPSPADGDLFKDGWWQYYDELPGQFDVVVQSWDCAFKDESDSDYVVGQVWGRRGANFYLIDSIRAKLDFPATVRAIKNMHAKHPYARAIYIEDKANGPAIIQTLRQEIPGIIPVNPRGSKYARAVSASKYAQAQNIYLPDGASWVLDFTRECALFPRAKHDDQVDAMSQAIIQLTATRKPAITKAKSNRRTRRR